MKRTIFYVMSLTWGLPMTLCGLVASIILIATGRKPQRWGWGWYFEIGNGGCGFSCGPFFFVSKGAVDSLKNHECGHGIQNAILGPIMVILTLASIIRFWYREIFGAKASYDDWWFEGDASRLGTDLINELNKST